jgi:hypothetical protein
VINVGCTRVKPAAPLALAGIASRERIERALFWLLVAGLAWCPFWLASNDLIAWGINAIIFPALTALYELSLLVHRERHPVGIKHIIPRPTRARKPKLEARNSAKAPQSQTDSTEPAKSTDLTEPPTGNWLRLH